MSGSAWIHEQVEVRGILVDAGIADLLEALWDCGYRTRFSCQDNPKGMTWVDFEVMDDAVRFVRLLFEVGSFRDGGHNTHAEIRRTGNCPGWEYGYSVRFPSEWKRLVLMKLQSQGAFDVHEQCDLRRVV